MAARAAYERLTVNGASAPTVTGGSIASSGAISVSCTSLTGWPTGKMPVGLNIGEADEEHVYATRSGNTLIVDSADRGADGTSAVAHDAGITVTLIQTADMADEANETVGETIGKITAAGEVLIGDGANSLAALDVKGDGKIVVGNGTTATSVAVSGDATLTNAGVVAVTSTAANAVDSDSYVDGSIDTAHIADAQVTLAKMAANSVDSDQYVDGSIDLIHMSANSVDSDQYVDGSIDLAHLASEVYTNTTYTPTLTQGSAVTKTVSLAKYQVVGGWCYATVVLTVTGTGSAGNTISVTLPVTGSTAATPMPIGTAQVNDTADAVYWALAHLSADGLTVEFYRTTDTTIQTIGVNPSFALASSDIVHFNVCYPVA